MSQHSIETHILEDDQDERDLIEECLKEDEEIRPFFVHPTSAELFDKIKDLRYGVISLDYKLAEGKNGLDVMMELRKRDEDEDFYLIIQTGHADEKLLLQFMNIRPNYFIIKGKEGEHLPELKTAIKTGMAHTRKKLDREEKRNEAIKKLYEMAISIGEQVLPYQQDHIENVDKTL